MIFLSVREIVPSSEMDVTKTVFSDKDLQKFLFGEAGAQGVPGDQACVWAGENGGLPAWRLYLAVKQAVFSRTPA